MLYFTTSLNIDSLRTHLVVTVVMKRVYSLFYFYLLAVALKRSILVSNDCQKIANMIEIDVDTRSYTTTSCVFTVHTNICNYLQFYFYFYYILLLHSKHFTEIRSPVDKIPPKMSKSLLTACFS